MLQVQSFEARELADAWSEIGDTFTLKVKDLIQRDVGRVQIVVLAQLAQTLRRDLERHETNVIPMLGSLSRSYRV